jgi:hypothetical protein
MKGLKVVLLTTVLLANASVFAEELKYKQFLRTNGENIGRVSLGMSEAEVREIMGSHTSAVRDGTLSNPWSTESNGKTLILHYLTRRNPPFTPIMENQATPVIFVDGVVSAIGRDYLRAARSSSAGNAPAAAGGGSGGGASVTERLKTLDDLLEAGSIDQETYDRQKERILDSL